MYVAWHVQTTSLCIPRFLQQGDNLFYQEEYMILGEATGLMGFDIDIISLCKIFDVLIN